MLLVTPIYASILVLLFITLSARVILTRRKEQVAIGNGAVNTLTRKIRVHGNFAEYIPFALLLMLMAELNTASNLLLHVAGVLLLIGRGFHFYAIDNETQNITCRVVGMALTFTSLGLLVVANLYLVFS
ncbi:MAG: MAPEG family protein [Patescibacteria group bacterium]